MNVTVFGATGVVGRIVVQRLLSKGHTVTAYARDPGKLALRHDALTIVAGELAAAGAVRDAVDGADAVISALGPSLSHRQRGMALVEGTRNVVDAMEEAGVTRYIGMATPSLRDERDRPSALGRIVPVLGRTLYPRAYRELLAMSAIVMESSLDWTIARFVRPTNGAPKGSVRAGFLGSDPVGATITRADIAGFLVEQLGDARYRRAAPAISN